jgi:vacuolar-type H+-ATPase subunit E/Vma4
METDRAEAARGRADAEAYAKDARAAADAYAEQRRNEAEREAAQVVDDAQRRLADAEAEVQRKMREATAEERQRIKALQADVARYEERLDSILVVFRGVTSQLENLLGERQAARSGRLDVSDEALEEALSPNRSGSRIG